MNVFVYEYASAQAPTSDLPDSIRQEGRVMLEAATEDFARIGHVNVTTLVSPVDDEEAAFKALASRADWSFIIAPELERLLESRCRWVEEAGGRLLGPSAEAVGLLGDKWRLHQLLTARGIPTPSTWLGELPLPRNDEDYVRKPRWGAGSTGVRRVDVDPEPLATNDLVQTFVPGLPASVAALVGPHARCLLLPAEQRLSDDGHFRYLGGRIPLPSKLAARACGLADQAMVAIQEHVPLRGYLGFDVVLGDDPSGSADVVIELNLRLTTSYVGLRALAQQNLMGVLLKLQEAQTALPLAWAPDEVVFGTRGGHATRLTSSMPKTRNIPAPAQRIHPDS